MCVSEAIHVFLLHPENWKRLYSLAKNDPNASRSKLIKYALYCALDICCPSSSYDPFKIGFRRSVTHMLGASGSLAPDHTDFLRAVQEMIA